MRAACGMPYVAAGGGEGKSGSCANYFHALSRPKHAPAPLPPCPGTWAQDQRPTPPRKAVLAIAHTVGDARASLQAACSDREGSLRADRVGVGPDAAHLLVAQDHALRARVAAPAWQQRRGGDHPTTDRTSPARGTDLARAPMRTGRGGVRGRTHQAQQISSHCGTSAQHDGLIPSRRRIALRTVYTTPNTMTNDRKPQSSPSIARGLGAACASGAAWASCPAAP